MCCCNTHILLNAVGLISWCTIVFFFPVALDYCPSAGLKGTPWIGNQSTISSDSLLLVRVLCTADTTGSGIYRKCSSLIRRHCTLSVVGGSVMCRQLFQTFLHILKVSGKGGALPVSLRPRCCWSPIKYQTTSFKDTVSYSSCMTAFMYCNFYIAMEHTSSWDCCRQMWLFPLHTGFTCKWSNLQDLIELSVWLSC